MNLNDEMTLDSLNTAKRMHKILNIKTRHKEHEYIFSFSILTLSSLLAVFVDASMQDKFKEAKLKLIEEISNLAKVMLQDIDTIKSIENAEKH